MNITNINQIPTGSVVIEPRYGESADAFTRRANERGAVMVSLGGRMFAVIVKKEGEG